MPADFGLGIRSLERAFAGAICIDAAIPAANQRAPHISAILFCREAIAWDSRHSSFILRGFGCGLSGAAAYPSEAAV
jgi:hypothetical protein